LAAVLDENHIETAANLYEKGFGGDDTPGKRFDPPDDHNERYFVEIVIFDS
jgi:hypothetical protein